MSELEFNTQVAEVMDMVSLSHKGRPRQWGIIVPHDQVQELLALEARRDILAQEMEARRDILTKELEERKRELARVENRTRQTMEMHGRASKVSKAIGVFLRLFFPIAYLIGACDGLINPMFATFLGGIGIFWAVCHWMEV